MVFYGDEVAESEILRYIDKFVIVEFVVSRFNCTCYT